MTVHTYEIIRITHWRDRGAWVTREKTFKKGLSFEEVVAFAKNNNCYDIEEFIHDMKEYGAAGWKGYSVHEW